MINFTKKSISVLTMYQMIFVLFALTLSLFAQPQYRINEARTKAEALQRSMDKSKRNITTSNQNSYDVKHYLIDINFDPARQVINGLVVVTAEITGNSLSLFDLDLSNNMVVDSVISGGSTVSYSRNGDLLTINLEKEYTSGETAKVAVYYNGSPEASGLGSFGFDSFNGKPLIWSLSEPYGAREWWPCKDAPGDKADSVDIKYTVPEGMIAASNGRLIDETTANGKTTFWWKENYPIATYLVSIAAYEYTHYTDEYIAMNGDTMGIDFFVAPEHYENSRYTFLDVSDMISVFAGLFGEYPFVKDKYGHAEFPWGGGMEHQTITSLGNIHSSNGLYFQGLIAHELAHMWWGDMITCSNFRNIWINEGFATYSEALLAEALYGKDSYKSQISLEEHYGGGTVIVDDTTDVNRIFSGALSYSKGAYVLHMLRHVVGDEDFFNILRTYADDPRFKYKDADTEDFRGVCEEVSGMNLEKFFDQWIYGEYFPQYSYGYTVNETGNVFEVNLVIDQIQTNTGLFWMPIDVEITTTSGKQTVVVWDSLETQTFTFYLDESPVKVELDPDEWILKKTSEKLVNASLDKGALLVNGLNWSLGDKVYSAYENSTFWGNTEISFWDLFDEPNNGYPAALPEAVGNGEIGIATLAQYSTIIWLSHNNGGDLPDWNNLQIMDYLEAGGNVILMTRTGRQFINDRMANYIGIDWGSSSSSIVHNCISTYSGVTDMELTSANTFIDLFSTEPAKDYSKLLFKTNESLEQERGMGIWANPPDGGQFVYIAARPYLVNQEDLKNNLEYIATTMFGEPVGVEDVSGSPVPNEFSLKQNYPNPFNPITKIRYEIPVIETGRPASIVSLAVYDILGKQVAVLVNEVQSPGTYEVEFNASELTSGIYFCELKANESRRISKMILLK